MSRKRAKIKSGDDLRDECAVAIREANRVAGELYLASDLQRSRLKELERHLQTVQKLAPVEELRFVLKHVESCYRLLNTMELGSYMISVNGAMEAAHRKVNQ